MNVKLMTLIAKKDYICRICLESSDDLVSLYDKIKIEENEESINSILLKCTGIEVKVDDDYPSNICSTCLVQLQCAYLFREKCDNSFNIYKSSLEHFHTVTQDDETAERAQDDGTAESEIEEESFQNTIPEEPSFTEIAYSDHDYCGPGKSHKMYPCNKCSVVSFNRYDSKQHQRTHCLNSKHTCKECGKGFPNLYKLKRHMITHSGKSPYSCPICKETFKWSATLAQHLRTHQLESNDTNKNKKLLCPACGKFFKNIQYFRIHFRLHTGETHDCKVCKKRFITARGLKVHSIVHTDNRPFACKLCNKTYRGPSIVKLHYQLKHLNIKPYKCKICPKEYSSSTALTVHLRTHTGEKPFTCSICDKSFSDKKYLKEHFDKHTGFKPLLCETCGKKFRRPNQLRRHEKTHLDRPKRTRNRKKKLKVAVEVVDNVEN